jgi:hypothetical protein
MSDTQPTQVTNRMLFPTSVHTEFVVEGCRLRISQFPDDGKQEVALTSHQTIKLMWFLDQHLKAGNL